MSGYRRASTCSFDRCVEVDMTDPGIIRVRNSERPDVEVTFTVDEWLPFVLGVQLGEFNPRREVEA